MAVGFVLLGPVRPARRHHARVSHSHGQRPHGPVHQFGTEVPSWNIYWIRLERGEGAVGLVIF